ncbi:phosphopantetheine-binding protein [[Mycoplasma] mobile]|uniref:Acyl carrier protein n=1 Tax=Mycoplasma mobile (strain ATCC 43663 / 163K / NCTC 11711) TaxID=267748 RepID=Q6KI70_MYCM1|nr:phosphopantetheine-binding protein [[Mycoplasma] mobile]AAT27706.1 acyl carrier protein [Mycoplasma mobile 163K]
MKKTRQEIQEIIFQALKSKNASSFVEDSKISEIGIDSLDLVELIIENEEKFLVQVSDDELTKLKSVKEVIDLFDKKINK